MYYKFRLIFILFVVDGVTVRRQFQDDHPFSKDDENAKSDKKNEDKFMLIPSIGYEMNDKPGKFTLTLNGWYYEPLNPGFIQNFITNSFQATLNLLDNSDSYTGEEKQERLGPFFVRDVKDHKIQLQLSKSISQSVVTDDNGRFHEKIIVDSLEGLNINEKVLKYIASDDDYQEQGYEGIIYLMKNKIHGGCSIISDIDDTIKISDVPSKKQLMINTFKKEFKAVPGMSNVYRSWQSLHNCLIHYVSAMPSQLYYVTQKFLNEENFPGGSFHMRHLKLVSSEKYQLVKKIIEFAKHDASQQHKLVAIQDILDHAPITQQFVMVGDSGELDPEIYGTIARKYSDRIKMIFIRLVKGGKNNDIRFETAFKDVPEDKWKVFSNADELPQKLYEDENPINENDDDDADGAFDPSGQDNATIVSMPLLYIILPMFVTLLFTMKYV